MRHETIRTSGYIDRGPAAPIIHPAIDKARELLLEYCEPVAEDELRRLFPNLNARRLLELAKGHRVTGYRGEHGAVTWGEGQGADE